MLYGYARYIINKYIENMLKDEIKQLLYIYQYETENARDETVFHRDTNNCADQILEAVLSKIVMDIEKLIETGVPNKGDTTGSDIKYGWNSAIDAVLEEIKNKLRA